MTWNYLIGQYIDVHCSGRGLCPRTMKAYLEALEQFGEYSLANFEGKDPAQIQLVDILKYLTYLREVRRNGYSAVDRTTTIIRNFYRAIVAMGFILPADNPAQAMPKMKKPPRKLPVLLNHDEVRRLLSNPGTDTVLGIRDRAILAVLYGAGIRASECATMLDCDVDLKELTIQVTGKGGHKRAIPLNQTTARILHVYREHRGQVGEDEAFFLSCGGNGLSRGSIYDIVRRHARGAGINKKISPHKLRHTFATHLVKTGANLVEIRDLLGHRAISSTQIYLHVTCEELRKAASRHPMSQFEPLLEYYLPKKKLPIQHPPKTKTG